MRPKPNKLHDDLDALLDGRPVELTEDLAPLVEAAGALRAELAELELDPEVADRHLERALEGGSATVVRLPVRQQPSGWDVRRRVAAVALAAALVLAPATMASAAALPGQAMYPFKLAIEQVRLAAVQWSPVREAGERTRVADERLGELNRLVDLKMFGQVLPAIQALGRAVKAADAAVLEAAAEGEPVGAGLLRRLDQVKDSGQMVVRRAADTVLTQGLPVVTEATRNQIAFAARQTAQVLAQPSPPPATGTPTPTPAATPTTGAASPGNPPPPQTAASHTTAPPPSSPPTTDPPPSTPPEPSTTDPPTTTSPPTTAATPGSAPPEGDQDGDDGRSSDGPGTDATPTSGAGP